MNLVDAFIQGMINGLGMFIIMTVLGTLTFFFLKPWLTRTVTEIWTQVRDAKVIEIKFDGEKKQ